MTGKDTEDDLPTRYGKKLYKTNPSIAGPFATKIKAIKTHKGSEAYMVSPNTGELLSQGAFGFVEEQEVDSEQFLKIYLAGIRQHAELNKPGTLLFELVYREMSGPNGKDRDTITLNFLIAQDWKPDLSKRTFERGMNELLEKGFLFRSIAADTYFVNVRFMLKLPMA